MGQECSSEGGRSFPFPQEHSRNVPGKPPSSPRDKSRDCKDPYVAALAASERLLMVPNGISMHLAAFKAERGFFEDQGCVPCIVLAVAFLAEN